MLVPSPRSSKAAEDPRTKLRRLIKRKTSERDRLRQEIEQCNAAMAPLAVKQATMEAMDEEIHGLFRRILERAKPRKREHQRLRQLYEQLQEDGIISPDPERAEQTAQRCDCPACSRANATDPGRLIPSLGNQRRRPTTRKAIPPRRAQRATQACARSITSSRCTFIPIAPKASNALLMKP